MICLIKSININYFKKKLKTDFYYIFEELINWLVVLIILLNYCFRIVLYNLLYYSVTYLLYIVFFSKNMYAI